MRFALSTNFQSVLLLMFRKNMPLYVLHVMLHLSPALGLVKFNFPNSHLVYLHDTNHREMFAYNYRALSSGCVRVENPVVLAKQILSSQEGDRWKSGEEVDKIIAKKDTYMVKVKQSIYIHQLYWTCWMNKNGLQFREDIYNLDLRVYSKLRS